MTFLYMGNNLKEDGEGRGPKASFGSLGQCDKHGVGYVVTSCTNYKTYQMPPKFSIKFMLLFR